MKDNKGVTLLALVITIMVLMIITATLTNKMRTYSDIKPKIDIIVDLQRITEKVENYYAENKELPILNKYGNIKSFINAITVNDNTNYYVVDLEKIGGASKLSLTYGIEGYTKVKNKDIKQEITDITDVFIVNEKSHIIYYPAGVQNGETIIYRLPEVISKYNNK